LGREFVEIAVIRGPDIVEVDERGEVTAS